MKNTSKLGDDNQVRVTTSGILSFKDWTSRRKWGGGGLLKEGKPYCLHSLKSDKGREKRRRGFVGESLRWGV